MGSFTVITAKDASISAAEDKKHLLINEADIYLRSKKWPEKAMMYRLNDTEKAQYNAWLDYLDALEAIDTGTSDINWPVQPA